MPRILMAGALLLGVLLPVAAEEGEAPPAEVPAEPATLESVQAEVAALRTEMRELQETLNLLVNQMMRDLEAENTQLRGEIQRLYQRGPSPMDLEGGFVPRPGAELFDEVMNEPPPPLAPAEFTWNVVKEWGREPEVAARLGEGVSSLKGMVVVVPEGAASEDIENLGRELHEQYNTYDNLNIEVYDNQEAAESYAETQVSSDPAHRVLSISKHRGTGRDKILLLQGGQVTELETGAPAPEAPAEAAEAPAAP
ncbi:MAG: hypothetical protein GC168_20050 [Candidatus Hydrogenedens sp.]|nr:hypothetical protein [Candidatus Hydrogenedens sp.]